uniref:hypothetical protein n=1 Tax=Methanocalculus natronophilus TaxID=1262400 RepID=UPI0031B63BF1
QISIEKQSTYQPKITMDYPVRFLEMFHKEWYDYIVENYRELWWHENEEPIWRILDRYKRHKNIKNEDMNALISDLKSDLKVH